MGQRSFPNPAVTDPAPCACDLRNTICDPNCCCDLVRCFSVRLSHALVFVGLHRWRSHRLTDLQIYTYVVLVRVIGRTQPQSMELFEQRLSDAVRLFSAGLLPGESSDANLRTRNRASKSIIVADIERDHRSILSNRPRHIPQGGGRCSSTSFNVRRSESELIPTDILHSAYDSVQRAWCSCSRKSKYDI